MKGNPTEMNDAEQLEAVASSTMLHWFSTRILCSFSLVLLTQDKRHHMRCTQIPGDKCSRQGFLSQLIFHIQSMNRVMTRRRGHRFDEVDLEGFLNSMSNLHFVQPQESPAAYATTPTSPEDKQPEASTLAT
ncbi:hypothetical protein AB1N83_006397 [Pleurotus pulmonarius]